MIKTGQTWAGLFVTLDATGALAAGTPSGTLYVDGVADAATVTITGSNPYKYSVTLPTLTAGQRVDMYITATISTIATASIVASEQADTVLVSDIVGADGDTLETLSDQMDAITTWTAAAIDSSITAGKITQIRGNTWDFDIEDLTLDDTLIQFAIKGSANDQDSKSILYIDTDGLKYVNGAAGTLTDGSLVYAGTTLTVAVDASVTALLPAGTYHYGIQSSDGAGVVSEIYGGFFTITADIVKATD